MKEEGGIRVKEEMKVQCRMRERRKEDIMGNRWEK